MADELSPRELEMLHALASMCAQYLDEREPGYFDHMCMSAGEEAVATLAKYGFMDADGRGGVFTDKGRELLDLHTTTVSRVR